MGAYACAATADRAHPACAWGSAVDQALPLLRHVERRLRVGGRPHDGGARAPHCHARSKRGVSRAVRAVPHAQVIEPHTAADGVAEIKAFINGTHVKHFLRLRTIVVRVLSTIFAAASGLAAGSEAPLIHIGAGVGSGVTRGDKMRNNVLLEFSPAILGLFHNDKDRRLFVSAGAAAGMAVAFGAPIGGVLWVLEETASAWTPALIWRMFTASLVASVTFAFLRAGHSAGDISVSGLLSLGGAHASEPVSLAQVCARNGMSS